MHARTKIKKSAKKVDWKNGQKQVKKDSDYGMNTKVVISTEMCSLFIVS